MRGRVFVFWFSLAALPLTWSGAVSGLDAPVDSGSAALPKVLEVGVFQPVAQVELIMAPRVRASRNLEMEIVVRNPTHIEIGIPDNMALSPGRLLLNWLTSSGAMGSRDIGLGSSGIRCGEHYSQIVPLAPFSYFGRKIFVDHEETRCIRIDSSRACNWPPDEYMFWIRMELIGQTAANTVPRGVYESAPVKVVIEE
jgi:hypothetical protein